MSDLSVNVQDNTYGPVSLDDGLQPTNIIVPGSPLPSDPSSYGNIPGISLTDASVNNATVTNNTNNFGSYKNKTYQVTQQILDVAVDQTFPVRLNVQGTMFWAIWATVAGQPSATAFAYVRFNDVTADRIPFAPGFQISGFPFSCLYIDFPAQVGGGVMYMLTLDDAPIDRVDAAV